MQTTYLDAIRNFEGFTPQASWDYAQHSNGYGTKARHAGEVIDKVEADRRFRAEIDRARSIVDQHAPDVDAGTKAALTSLTYNAGDAWTRSGLGSAVRGGDLGTAKELFLQYNKAGGEVLSGLAKRREAEAAWIGQPGLVEVAVAEVPATTGPAAGPTSQGGRATRAEPARAPLPAAKDTAGVTPEPILQPVNERSESEYAERAEATAGTSGTVSDVRFEAQARLTKLMLAADFIGAASAKRDDKESPVAGLTL